MRTRMFLRALVAAPLAALLLAVPARAEIVYDQGGYHIDVAQDDGSSPATLVTLDDTPEMKTLNAPAVNPHGTTVVFEGLAPTFDARAPAACGDRCSGVYQDAGGHITRLTPLMPGPCSGPCALLEGQPEIGPTGQVVASYLYAYYVMWVGIDGFPFWDLSPGGSWTGLTQPPHGSPVDDQSTADIPTPCSGHDISVQPQYPSLSADGTKLVYANCTDSGTGAFETIVADAHGGSPTVCGTDDVAITDPSFSLDGSRVVDAEAGDKPGLWDYACPFANAVYALAAPANVTFQSPRYDSHGRILFVAVQPSGSSNTSDVFAIPATCGSGGTPCSFPRDATQITHTGEVSNVAWTSGTIPAPAGDTTGGTGPSTTTPPPGPSPLPPAPNPTVSPIIRLATSGRHLLRFAHGLPVAVSCASACSGKLTVTIPAAAARKAHLGRKAITLAHGRFSAGGGKTATVNLAVSKARRKALRRVRKLTVKLTAIPTVGLAAHKTARLTR